MTQALNALVCVVYERRVNGRGRDHKARPIKLLREKDLEAAGVGLDTVFKIGRVLRFRNEIDSPETRDPLKRPGEPPNRPQEFGAAIGDRRPHPRPGEAVRIRSSRDRERVTFLYFSFEGTRAMSCARRSASIATLPALRLRIGREFPLESGRMASHRTSRGVSRVIVVWTVLVVFFLATFACGRSAERYDIVFQSGRVIDPETGLDAIRDVGIRGDAIARISNERLTGQRVIDAGGLVVSPGFIDLHDHAHSPEAYRLLALDGVTTALELEIGVPDIKRFIDVRRERTPINYGATASHLAARALAWDTVVAPSTEGPEAGIIPQSGAATNDPASAQRLEAIIRALRIQIEAGALGVGLGCGPRLEPPGSRSSRFFD